MKMEEDLKREQVYLR